MVNVEHARKGHYADFGIQVTFDVPGEISAPVSVGVIIPRRPYKSTERRMYVAVGLPPEPAEDPYREALSFLWKAVMAAEEYMRSKKIAKDADAIIEIMRTLDRNSPAVSAIIPDDPLFCTEPHGN
jgi:hypothetical protein